MSDSSPPSDQELGIVLESVVQQEGNEGFTRPDGITQERGMEIINELLGRRWVNADAQNAGDDRLISVRGLRPTALGMTALADLRRRAIRPQNPSAVSLEEKKRRRAELMATLYDYSDGLELKSLSVEDLARLLEWSVDDTDAVLEYLEHEGLVELLGMGPEVGISHRGVTEVEYAVEHPDETTEHFLPHTVVVVHGDMQGSQIQAGTMQSQQELHSGVLSRTQEVAVFIDALRAALVDAPISGEDRAAAESTIISVESQLHSPKPNVGILREGLKSLRAVVESIAGSGAFAGLVELARHLPS